MKLSLLFFALMASIAFVRGALDFLTDEDVKYSCPSFTSPSSYTLPKA